MRNADKASNFGAELRLPFKGEVFVAEQKEYLETVVFIHQFGGNKRSLSRHVRLVNDIGFNAVVFNLQYHDAMKNPNQVILKHLPISADLHFGIRHIWQEQIELVLNSIPGNKIVYSFSMPTNSAFFAVANRKAEDIKGLVCDGGPFLQVPHCIWNLYERQFGIKSRLLRTAFTATSLALYGIGTERDLIDIAKKIPRGFPVLSIRGQADHLIPSDAIDEFFDELPSANVDRVIIDEAGHLEGLTINAMKYRQNLFPFLTRLSQRH